MGNTWSDAYAFMRQDSKIDRRKNAMQVFERNGDNLEELHWKQYKKKTITSATKIAGPFTVKTSEGDLKCEDGYLAIDARGYPYPIATDEFDLIYDPV